jgi:hypothetical protein
MCDVGCLLLLVGVFTSYIEAHKHHIDGEDVMVGVIACHIQCLLYGKKSLLCVVYPPIPIQCTVLLVKPM